MKRLCEKEVRAKRSAALTRIFEVTRQSSGLKPFALTSILLLASCSPLRDAVREVPIRETVTDTLVPRTIPADSAELRIAFDDRSNAFRTTFEREGARLKLYPVIRHDTLIVYGQAKPDTLWLPARTVTREVPVTVEVVKEVPKPLSWWQKALQITGALALLALIGGLALRMTNVR